jgi:hypothetical protein
MARQEGHARAEAAATGALNPIATAYFRAVGEHPSRGPAEAASSHPTIALPAHVVEDVSSSIEAVIELLAEAGVMPERPRALLESAKGRPDSVELTRLRQSMAYVGETDPTASSARRRELAFLANALLAGCSVQSRPFTPREASEAAASVCNLGLEYWPGAAPSSTPTPESFLVDHDLVTVFEVGWSVLHREVSMFVVQQLISTLDELRIVDVDIERDFAVLRRTLVDKRDAGTPWLARGAADVLAILDVAAWTSVVGLLSECPVLPSALTAVLERRTTAVSSTAFNFISTAAQIGDVRVFMRALRGVLSR